jgi:exopolysaccharide production protein ExoQ
MSSGLSKLENEGHSDSPTIGLPFAVGFYFAFRLFIMLLSVRLLGMDSRTGTGLDLASDYLLLLFVAFCSLGEVRLQFRQMAKLPSIRWALLFLGFSCCSLLWSSTVSMSTSIAYWCGMAADVAIVIMLLRAEPLTRVAESLMKGYVWGACLVAIIAWLMPAQSDLRLGDEELLGANQIGYLCAFAFFFAQYLMREKKGRLGIQALFLAVTVLRTLSKTTIAAFLVGEGFLLIKDKSISRKSKILILLAAAAVVAASWSLLTSYYEIYTNGGTQSETLTGRLGIWAYIMAEAVQQPWIGHGFDSVWKVIPPFGADQFEAAHAHNEVIQQFYAYGLVGVGLLTAIYGSFYRHIRRLAAGPFRTFCFAFLLFVLVRGFADTERFDLSFPLWAIVILSLLIDQARARQEKAATLMAIEPSPSTIIPQDLSFIPFIPERPAG